MAWWVNGGVDLPRAVGDAGQYHGDGRSGSGMSVVGVAVPAALLPGEPLRAGDQVRVVATPGQQGEVTEEEQRSSPPRWWGSIRG
jgi:hypothetical protein